MPAALPRQLRTTAASCATAVALTLGLAACGGDDDADSAAAPASTPASSTPAPSTPTATSGPTPRTGPGQPDDATTPRAAPSERETGDFSVPEAAKGESLPKVGAERGVTIKAPAGDVGKWTLTGKLDSDEDGDAFCTTVDAPGARDVDPLCFSGTSLALMFFSDQAEAHAVADLDQIAKSKRLTASQLVVSGIAAADVKRVVVKYGGQTLRAKLSTQATTVPVDKAFAKTITGASDAEIARLPDEVTVRAFAVGTPIAEGNPPKDAVAETFLPVGGTMTFQLQ